ncbi:MAG: nucleotidyltransferase domain-containing protein [Parachlamydiaceae bacterium]
MIHIEPRHLEIVKTILSQYPYEFHVFGSRAKGIPRRFSDLDLCFFDHIPWNIQAHIEEDFEESDLPYKVDLVDWNACDESFQNLIKRDLILIQPAKPNNRVA